MESNLVLGSFTDHFVIMLGKARNAGATPADLNARLDRVLALAKQKKYLSSVLREVDESGPGRLDAYIAEVKNSMTVR